MDRPTQQMLALGVIRSKLQALMSDVAHLMELGSDEERTEFIRKYEPTLRLTARDTHGSLNRLIDNSVLPIRYCDDCDFETQDPLITLCPDVGCCGSVG